jgi:hypothetical protein
MQRDIAEALGTSEVVPSKRGGRDLRRRRAGGNQRPTRCDGLPHAKKRSSPIASLRHRTDRTGRPWFHSLGACLLAARSPRSRKDLGWPLLLALTLAPAP